ncbi:hypothetical protein BV22DRAFT_1124516 [Leucogyrophana mollusca]|uniref:Uncharacterized protein n=1 Tax=Leucogyrophana mollusca TaxID=85980 RepID=A0ACB8C1T6_9AGAM|nr:hypothetical protein BV22DRAFT_1124516 [Leucogyrophana mollusca]
MASNASSSASSCYGVTNWYTFSSSLTLSDNCEVALILSDIPFISTGILVFGVSILFISMKRFTIAALVLYSSIFLAFAASILDLSQLVARGLDGPQQDTAVHPLITTREIILAVSLGLRFIFYWIFVSEPPRAESQPLTAAEGGWTNFLVLEANDELHSGSWGRWGPTGQLLKHGLLLAAAAITALQIVWRIVSQFHRYSPIYAADTALELVTSVLLILKLLLNTVVSPATPRSHTFQEYAAPIFALFVNVGIAIGNLICFAFTESTLGRFLQGVELYILIVFVMIINLQKFSQDIAIQRPPSLGQEAITLPQPSRESTFRVSPPIIPTPSMSMIFPSGRNASTEAIRRSARASARVTSWVSTRISRNRSIPEEDQTRLWNQSESEKGMMEPADTHRNSMADSIAIPPESVKEWKDIVSAAAPPLSPTPPLEYLPWTNLGRQREGSPSSSRLLNSRLGVPRLRTSDLGAPAASVSSLDSYYGKDSGHAVIMTAPPDPQAGGLPIYGLNGMRRPQLKEGSNTARKSSMSFEELLRQQSELDRSIAALRLFSPRSSPSNPSNPPSDKSSEADPSEKTRFSSSTVAMSDFSLSNFPEPPWVMSPMPALPSPLPPSSLRMREDRRARLALVTDLKAAELRPPRMPAVLADIPSSPHFQTMPESPCRGDNESLAAAAGRPPRFNSGGTQYDVTSFIGDLTTPGGHTRGPTEGPWESSETEINLAAIVDGNLSRASSPLPHVPSVHIAPLVPRSRLTGLPSNPAKYKLSPLSMNSKLSSVNTVSEESASVAPRKVNPTIFPSLSVSPSASYTINPTPTSKSTPGKGIMGLPARPRLAREISSPKPPPQDGTGDQAPSAFEHPRPPPIISLPSGDHYGPYGPLSPAQDAG